MRHACLVSVWPCGQPLWNVDGCVGVPGETGPRASLCECVSVCGLCWAVCLWALLCFMDLVGPYSGLLVVRGLRLRPAPPGAAHQSLPAAGARSATAPARPSRAELSSAGPAPLARQPPLSPGCERWVSDAGLHTDAGLWTAGYGLLAADCGLRTLGCGRWG